jgi:hypothetical protein
MADDKEQVGTVVPAPKPTPVTIFDWLPEWIPGSDALKKAARDAGKARERVEKDTDNPFK